jgi:hypothetical protein
MICAVNSTEAAMLQPCYNLGKANDMRVGGVA